MTRFNRVFQIRQAHAGEGTSPLRPAVDDLGRSGGLLFGIIDFESAKVLK